MDIKPKALPFYRTLFSIAGFLLFVFIITLLRFNDKPQVIRYMQFFMNAACIAMVATVILNRIITGLWGDLHRIFVTTFTVSALLYFLQTLKDNYTYNSAIQTWHIVVWVIASILIIFFSRLIPFEIPKPDKTEGYPLPRFFHLFALIFVLGVSTWVSEYTPIMDALQATIIAFGISLLINFIQWGILRGKSKRKFLFFAEILAMVLILGRTPLFQKIPFWLFFVLPSLLLLLLGQQESRKMLKPKKPAAKKTIQHEQIKFQTSIAGPIVFLLLLISAGTLGYFHLLGGFFLSFFSLFLLPLIFADVLMKKVFSKEERWIPYSFAYVYACIPFILLSIILFFTQYDFLHEQINTLPVLLKLLFLLLLVAASLKFASKTASLFIFFVPETIQSGPNKQMLLSDTIKAWQGKSRTFIKEGFLPWWKKTAPERKAFFIKAKQKITKPKVWIPASAVIVIIVLVSLSNIIFTTRVVSFSPNGTVSSKINIRATYSGFIQPLKEDIISFTNKASSNQSSQQTSDIQLIKSGVSYFKIEPPLAGTYRIEKNRTIVFVPDQELPPASTYTVKIDTKRLINRKPFLAGGKISFNMDPFKLVSTRSFFTYDALYGLEKYIVAEVNFNYPVDPAKLKEHLSIIVGGKMALSYQLEASDLPTRFYIRTLSPSRGSLPVNIKIRIDSSLTCLGSEATLRIPCLEELTLPGNVKKEFYGLSGESLPVSGTTYMAIQFNMPIRADALKQYSRVYYVTNIPVKNEKFIPRTNTISYEIENEYCYAVIKADFLPNRSYYFQTKKGMPSSDGTLLKEDFNYGITISDRDPAIAFAAAGNILPLNGRMTLKMYTVNMDQFTIRIDKIFRNNLIPYLRSKNESDLGVTETLQTIKVTDGALNEQVPQYIDLKKLQNTEYKGFFKIRIESTADTWKSDTKYVLCTDLGIMAKHSGNNLIIKVYSINSLTPVAGAAVKLISWENQPIREVTTDDTGTAIITDWQVNRYKFRPAIITAEKADDYSYLNFSDNEINQSRFGTDGGLSDPQALRAFMTPERGVYRPGDKAIILAIVRKGENIDLPTQMPVNLRINDPSGALFTTFSSQVPKDGMMAMEVTFPDYAKTGIYSATLNIGNDIQIGSTTFKVEEFMPDKIKVNIDTTANIVRAGDSFSFTVRAEQMAGPPAGERKVITSVNLIHREFTHPAWPSYSFGDPYRQYDGETFDLGESKLDKAGLKKYTLRIPKTVLPPSALSARIYSEVYDEGGRQVSAVRDIQVDPYPVYVGLKVEGKDIFLKDEPITFSWTSINPQGRPALMTNARIFIKQKIYYSILRKYGGKYGYTSDDYQQILLDKKLALNGPGQYTFTPNSPGEYTIFVGDEDGMHSITKISVQGAGYESMDMERADSLVIRFNKLKYSPGETAYVTVLSPIPGKLFLNIEREKVLWSTTVDLVNNKAVIPILITEDFSPNVYISGYVIRKPDENMELFPMSALGIRNMDILANDRQMNISLSVPAKTRAANGLNVAAAIPTPSPYARIALFAVDEGILQITQFETPKPFDFFNTKRALQTRLFSIFNALLPDVTPRKMAIGGDEGEYSARRRHLNPVQARRVKSVSLFSGIITPDNAGNAYYHFKIPEFNGRLRVMALAADQKRFASASSYVTVADPILLNTSLPRILAPGDLFEIPIRCYNQTGADGTFNVQISVSGPIRLMSPPLQTIHLKMMEEKRLLFRAEALSNAGKAIFVFKGSGNGETTTSTIELAVRPVQTLTTIGKRGKLAPGTSASIAIPSGFIPFGQRVRIVISPLLLSQFMGSLDYLIDYPYGCLEQTTSRVFPLLYLKQLDLITSTFQGRAGEIDKFINEGLRKIEGMMLSDGQFAYWPGETEPAGYASFYADEVLLYASRLGYRVDPVVLQKVKDNISALYIIPKGRLDRRNQNLPSNYGNADMYILYLQALAGSPNPDALQEVLKQRLKKMDLLNRCYLASALAFSGDKKNAKLALPSAFKVKYFPRSTGGSFDSYTKRLAFYLDTLCEVDPESPQRTKLAEELMDLSKDGQFQTTQECVFAIRALFKAYRSQKEIPINVDLLKNNQLVRTFTGLTGVYSDNTITGKTITLKNNATSIVYYSMSGEGTKLIKEKPSLDRGITIQRSYFDQKGRPLNLKNVVQGQLIVATISLSVKKKGVSNLVVVDLLPAGFEVENARLRSRGNLEFEPYYNWESAYEDIRDDRIVLFTGSVWGSWSYSYTMRAITPGEFDIPQVTAEAMYDPDIKARDADQGRVVIIPGQ